MITPEMPTIETARLRLRLMQPTDFDALLPIFTASEEVAFFRGELFTLAQMQA